MGGEMGSKHKTGERMVEDKSKESIDPAADQHSHAISFSHPPAPLTTLRGLPR
jgi:hypothetical protein